MAAYLVSSVCLLLLLSGSARDVAATTEPDVGGARNDCREEEEEPLVERRAKDLLDQVLPQDCGQRFLPNNRIAGGYDATRPEFPSFVRLDLQWPQGGIPSLCGGVIISGRHVLTAARCLLPWGGPFKMGPIKVAASIFPANSPLDKQPGPTYNVNKHCVSPKFNLSTWHTNHDIALLRLDTPIKFSNHVQPVCLPRKPSKGKEKLKAVGLGAESKVANKPVMATQLQVLPVKWAPCWYKEDEHFTKVCLDNDDPWYVGDTCEGDYGGPVYDMEEGRMVVAAISSYGSNFCEAGRRSQSINTDVYAIRDELARLMKECQ